jgi:hypothetical protein
LLGFFKHVKLLGYHVLVMDNAFDLDSTTSLHGAKSWMLIEFQWILGLSIRTFISSLK